jgi:hypothetical protein
LYLDLALLFESSFNHTYKIVKYVVQNWLIHESFYPINGVPYCQDDEKMLDVALQFACASRGVISGCVGVLDGWVVKIKNLHVGMEWRIRNHFTVERGILL